MADTTYSDTSLKNYAYDLSTVLKFVDKKGRRTQREEVFLCEASHPELETTSGGNIQLQKLSGPKAEGTLSELGLWLDGGDGNEHQLDINLFKFEER